MPRRCSSVSRVIGTLLISLAPQAAVATSFLVDDAVDAPDLIPGDGVCASAGATCTLRAAVEEANTLAGQDDILLPAGTYVLSLGELSLTSDANLSGDGADVTVVDADAVGRVLSVSSGATVVVSGVTLRNGLATTSGSGVSNLGSLTLDECAVAGNVLAGGTVFGAGVSNHGTLLVQRSTISGNLLVPTSFGAGAGIYNDGSVTIADSTVSGNGGGSLGGGIVGTPTAVTNLRNVTIAGNSASTGGGGIYCGPGSAVTIRNSIIADNPGGDCACALLSEGYLLVEGGCPSITGTLAGLQTGLDPLLLPLGSYGGPTLTHELDAGSPAIDAANPAAPGSGGFACEALDQRGTTRPNGAACDLGATEQVAPLPTPTPSPTPSPTPVPTATPPCPGTPLGGCRQPIEPGRGLFQLLDKSPDERDRVKWKWIEGAVTPKSDFGDPTTTTAYQLCVYDGSPTPILGVAVPAGSAAWRERATGFVYSDPEASAQGAHKLVLKQGLAPGQARIVFKGKGALLDDTAPPLAQPVIVQLRNSEGVCWEAQYSAPADRNEGEPPVRQFEDHPD